MRKYCYEPTIPYHTTDATSRRNFIANATSLIRMCKGRNIIMSSQAMDALGLRGPYDVAALGSLVGLTKEVRSVALMSIGLERDLVFLCILSMSCVCQLLHCLRCIYSDEIAYAGTLSKERLLSALSCRRLSRTGLCAERL